MTEIAIPLPVSVEQIAAAVEMMSPVDLDRLLKLAPRLGERATSISQQIEQKNEPIDRVQAWVMEALDQKPLSSDAPFFDGLTLGEFLALSDDDQSALWNKWQGTELYDMDEVEVEEDAVPA
ncbi:MAG: hypothetical protein AAF702_33420 [Chloroflexota bacterium]